MTEYFSFFDAVETSAGVYDREYNAQQFTDYFKTLVNTGVMKGNGEQLEVTPSGSNMTTYIGNGVAFINGRYYHNDDELEHTHDTETRELNRIDRVVIRMDLNTNSRFVKSFIKKGVAAVTPIAPALTQIGNIYEISLAQIKITGGQTFITNSDIKDERGTNIICPWAGSNILPNFDDSTIGQPNGIATLDSKGSVPLSQLANIPPVVDATTNRKGIVQLSTVVNNNSNSLVPTTSITNYLNNEIIDLKSSVSNGKAQVANAITRKGVATSPTAEFATMASNIDKIQTGDPYYSGTATTQDAGGYSYIEIPAIDFGNKTVRDINAVARDTNSSNFPFSVFTITRVIGKDFGVYRDTQGRIYETGSNTGQTGINGRFRLQVEAPTGTVFSWQIHCYPN